LSEWLLCIGLLATPLHQSIKATIEGLFISRIFTDDPLHQELFGLATLALSKLLLKQSALATGLANTNFLDLFQSQRAGWI
jgi:hypothetical protein